MDEYDAGDVRDRLSEERAAAQVREQGLRRRLSSVVEEAAWTSHDDEHDPEGSTVAFERAQLQGQLEQAERDISEIDSAVRRVQDGTYGLCAGCGDGIAEQRLEALPAARVCVTCAESRR